MHERILFEKYGRSATAFRALAPDLLRWMPADRSAFVGYTEVPGAWVAAGDPVAPIERLPQVAQQFVDAARRAGQRASFFASETHLSADSALQRQLIGEQPVWDPRGWARGLASHRSLREQLRRARAKGVTIRELPPGELESAAWRGPITVLYRRWRAAQSMASMRFLVAIDREALAAGRRTWIAERHGVLMGLASLAPVPARAGWILEHLLRDPDAPNGTAEALVDQVMRSLAHDDVGWVTLGLAPLHGDVGPVLTRIRTWSTPLFNFEGLAHFKRKLRPHHWEPVYLAWPRASTIARTRWTGVLALRDALRAFAAGSFLRFGWRSILRGPRPLLHILQWLLAPWTLMLALAPVTPWFPSTTTQAAWVAFDGVLLLAFRVLHQQVQRHGHEGRQRAAQLSLAIATAISGDALLTLWQAGRWNAATLSGWREWLVLIVACAAPTLAAVLMWGTTRRLNEIAVAPSVTPSPVPSASPPDGCPVL